MDPILPAAHFAQPANHQDTAANDQPEQQQSLLRFLNPFTAATEALHLTGSVAYQMASVPLHQAQKLTGWALVQ